MISFRVVAMMACVVALSSPAMAQRIGWKPVTSGNMQWGQASGGSTTYQQIGSTTLGSDGSRHYQFGDTTISSDGRSSLNIGNTSVSSDGSVAQQIGDTQYERLSNGQMKTCRRYGENVFCSWN